MSEKTEFAGWWMWVLLLVVISAPVLGILNYAGMIGRTVVEREVFERSYQYTAAVAAQIALYEAQLAELAAMPETPGLRAQKAGIRIRLNTARRRITP